MVKYLIERHNCDPDRKDDDGYACLDVAGFQGSFKVLKNLIEERKCYPKYRGRLGKSLLHYTCDYENSLPVLKCLIEKHGCGPTLKDDEGETVLNVAVGKCTMAEVKHLVEKRKCNPNEPCKRLNSTSQCM